MTPVFLRKIMGKRVKYEYYDIYIRVYMSNRRIKEIYKDSEMDQVILTALGIPKYHGLTGYQWAVYFSILAAFGKRVSEVIELQRRDVRWDDEFLSISFRIRKKRSVKPVRTKKIILSNQRAKTIKNYCENLKDMEYLFPAKGCKTGHIWQRYAWDTCQLINEKLALKGLNNHTFRHSLATTLAGEKFTAFELKSWFDWAKIDMADHYVRESGITTMGISRRESK